MCQKKFKTTIVTFTTCHNYNKQLFILYYPMHVSLKYLCEEPTKNSHILLPTFLARTDTS